ncbi:MAG: hypothetical protein KY475_02820 [Planctomycetes bacterium]|nr:hypothetical protein [Planctomycetota bacterium]
MDSRDEMEKQQNVPLPTLWEVVGLGMPQNLSGAPDITPAARERIRQFLLDQLDVEESAELLANLFRFAEWRTCYAEVLSDLEERGEF